MAEIEEKVNFLSTHLTSLFRKHAPIKTSRVTKPPAPWLTPALKALMKERDKALAKFKSNKSLENLDNHKMLRNLTLYTVRREKLGYLEFLDGQRDSRSLWRGLRNLQVYSSSKSASALPAALQNADEINNYFLRVFRKTGNCVNRSSFYKNNKKSANLLFSFGMETPESVYKYVYSLKSNAAGNDEITLNMLKLSLPVILLHLTHILNSCLERGYFPECWKESIVCPVPKVNNPSTITELRPISLLPVFSKVLERIVHTQVSLYLKTNNLLPVHQSGFREGHSTSTALLNLNDNIIRALDKKMAVISVSLDYSKAFDVLDHDLLCAKLHYIGFDEISQSFFHNYLTGRQQRVRVNRVCSDAGNIISGVPQGSILGPLLFLIYTSDIFEEVLHSHVQTYADDVQLLHLFDPLDPTAAMNNVNADLSGILLYSTEHNLMINPDKTQVLLFCQEGRRNHLETTIKLKITNENLHFANTIKNLGLIMDVGLRYREHVKLLLQKSYAKMKMLYANRYILNFKLRKKLCESLILSSFNYCNIVYYPCLDLIAKNRLQYVQNVCCRFVYKLRKYDHVSQKIKELKWLKISNTVQLHYVVFLMKLLRSSVPIYLKEKLLFRSVIHSRTIRDLDLLTMPQYQTALFQRCFTYMAVKIYNSLPVAIKKCPSIISIRYRYRELLLSQQ